MSRDKAFHQTISKFPQQFRVGVETAKGIKTKHLGRKVHHLIICGMGGSAMPGVLLTDLVRFDPRTRSEHLHVAVHRDYGLPPEAVAAPAVVVVISYSGNTEEALSAYRESKKRRLPVFVITSGGALSKLAKQDKIPCLLIPKGVEPRFAVGYQFGALMGLCAKLGFLPSFFQRETLALEKELRPRILLSTAKSLIAPYKKNKRLIPLIFSSPALAGAAYSWKTNIHENAKLPASVHVFPELNHNELNVFTPFTPVHKTLLSFFLVFMIQDEKEDARTKKRFALTKKLIERLGIPVQLIEIKGKTCLERIFTAYLLGLTVSGLIAERLGINPLPVPIIETFKKRLRE